MVVVATEAAVTEVAAAASVAALRVARRGGAELAVEMEVEMEMVVEAETEVEAMAMATEVEESKVEVSRGGEVLAEVATAVAEKVAAEAAKGEGVSEGG